MWRPFSYGKRRPDQTNSRASKGNVDLCLFWVGSGPGRFCSNTDLLIALAVGPKQKRAPYCRQRQTLPAIPPESGRAVSIPRRTASRGRRLRFSRRERAASRWSVPVRAVASTLRFCISTLTFGIRRSSRLVSGRVRCHTAWSRIWAVSVLIVCASHTVGRRRSAQATNHAHAGLLSACKINGYAFESLLSNIPIARPRHLPRPARRKPPRPFPRPGRPRRTRPQ
jgi:hypothetical protein